MRIITIFFLSISLNMCFGCSKETSRRDSSFEFPERMFWLRNKKTIFQSALLSGGLLEGCKTKTILSFPILFYNFLNPLMWNILHSKRTRRVNVLKFCTLFFSALK